MFGIKVQRSLIVGDGTDFVSLCLLSKRTTEVSIWVIDIRVNSLVEITYCLIKMSQ